MIKFTNDSRFVSDTDQPDRLMAELGGVMVGAYRYLKELCGNDFMALTMMVKSAQIVLENERIGAHDLWKAIEIVQEVDSGEEGI